ncbi:ATP-binding protein [Streptomyces sp. NPDC007083]|uniref:ATP-binding protein n=1 Tax=Streptomyces sp. NPDC007083 TaxID=3156913 RepID=UPI0033D6CD9A
MTSMMDRQHLAMATDGVGAKYAKLEVECEATAVRNARDFTRAQLATWGFLKGSDFSERVVLVISELVTNAVQHARTRPPGENESIDIATVLMPDHVVGILVADNSPRAPLCSAKDPAEATHGRGLLLVSALADGWTALPRPFPDGAQGKGIWAFFECPTVEVLPRLASRER